MEIACRRLAFFARRSCCFFDGLQLARRRPINRARAAERAAAALCARARSTEKIARRRFGSFNRE